MKRILFVIPPHGSFESYMPSGAGKKKNFLTPPYGALSIISYANEDKEHDIQIFDCNKYIFEHLDSHCLESSTFNELCRTVLFYKPDYIFVSALFNTSFPHMKIIGLMKVACPNTIVFVGGGLATNLYKELFDEFPDIDAICFGEGEIPVKKLLDFDVSIEELHKISPAWITKNSFARGCVPKHDMIEDIDDIPLIDYSYIDFEKYNGRSYIDKDPKSNKIELSIHTSRGCPFNCVFCANSSVHGKRVRMMSFKRVAETIRHYRDKYGVTILMVEDDHFLYNKKRALEILKYIRNNKINVEFPNGIAVYKIDNDIAKALADAKVRVITLAIESGSDYVLKQLIDKPLTVKKIKEVVGILKQYDIRIHAFIVIGLPGESDEDRKETLETVIELGVDWVYVFIAIPIVGSRLYTLCDEKGYLINRDYGNHFVANGNIRAPGVEPEDIEEYAYYMNTIINFIFNSNFLNRKYDVAEEYFLNVIRSYPEQAIAHYMLSILYRETERYDKSNEHYQKYCIYYDKHLAPYKNSKYWQNLLKNIIFGCNEGVSYGERF